MNHDNSKVEILEKYLENHRRFLLNDAAASTGIAIFDVQQNLDVLLEKYDCRLQVSDKGEIIYDFADLSRRGKMTFQEYLKIAQKWLWEAFKVFFRLWIAVTLVVYFVVFLVIIIAFIIAFLVASDGDGDVDFDFGDVFGDLFTGIFQWNTVGSTTYTSSDSRGYDYKRYDAKPSMSARMKRKLNGKNKEENKKENKKEHINVDITQKPSTAKVEKGFTACIYDFVLGEPRYQQNTWHNQQEIASYLRASKGIITLSELKSLNGLPKYEAENMFSDCLFRFEGSAQVSEDGVLYGDFSNFVRKVDQKQGVPIEFYWNEYEAPYELTGNGAWTNTWVIGLNLFNLCCSAVGIGMGTDPEYNLGTWVEFGLGWIPFTFSALFFAVPFLRSFTLIAPSIRRRKKNIAKRLMKVIFVNEGKSMTLEEITEQVNSQKGLETLEKNTIEKHLNDLLHNLEGEQQIDEKANIVYVFDRVTKDLKTAEKLRKNRLNDDSMQIVFDSKE